MQMKTKSIIKGIVRGLVVIMFATGTFVICKLMISVYFHQIITFLLVVAAISLICWAFE